jgi:hypothetical protein
MEGSALRSLISLWEKKLKLAREYADSVFFKRAEECMAFLEGPHDFIYGAEASSIPRKTEFLSKFFGNDGSDIPAPSFKATVNKAAELVQVYGPALYFRNPNRQVKLRPLPPFDPSNYTPQFAPVIQTLMQDVLNRRPLQDLRAGIMQSVLNYTPRILDLQGNSRLAIDEGLIAGRGVQWVEMYQPPAGGQLLAGSFYDTVHNLLIDPDMPQMDSAAWIARKRRMPYFEVEDMFRLPRGSLKKYAREESVDEQSRTALSDFGRYNRNVGNTSDLLAFWEIYSRVGVGDKLKDADDRLSGALDGVGDFVYLAFCKGCPYFLNLPDEFLESPESGAIENIQARVDWPIPFWAVGMWPCATLDFHPHTRRAWPTAHLTPALGELQFIDYTVSFMMSKVARTSRDFIAIAKSAAEELRNVVMHGNDLSILEIEGLNRSIGDVVQFLQHPPMNTDLIHVLEKGEELFDKRTGLNELLYGNSPKQLRSAKEAQIKGENARTRSDDMANAVELHHTKLAWMEALAIRWKMRGADVQRLYGPVFGQMFDQYVSTADVHELLHELDYTIEAGSGRRPNLETDQNNMQAAAQTILPILQQYSAASGDVKPINRFLQDWAKSIQLDASQYMLQPPPPPAPAPGPAAPTLKH